MGGGRDLAPVSLEEVRAAAECISGTVLRSPLLRLEEGPADVYLKLECLQPVGSFKIRGAAVAMALANPKQVARGVYTASAGNMAQGLAHTARARGVPCTAVVPETAPRAKLDAIARLGASFVKEPFDAWWRVMVERSYGPLADRLFVHPFADPAVMAGNGTIGLEILEDLPDVEAVVVPFGGGGLICGIASAVKALRPEVRVVASEVETAAPLAASLRAGRVVEVPYAPSFVDGIGSKRLLDEMWPLVRELVDGSVVCSLEETAAAVRLLAERARVVAEGAAATAVAAAVRGAAGTGKVVAVVSGGNLDPSALSAILEGRVPGPASSA